MPDLRFVSKLWRSLHRPAPKAIRIFQEWARDHAVVIDPLDGLNGNVEKLSFLDSLLENKRIVYLGEEDHWVHEKSDYRLLFLRYLISRGWRYIGEELGWSDGMRINCYLGTGDLSSLEKIATYGYKGGLRFDREDKPTGLLKGANENYPVAEFKREQLRLIKALGTISRQYDDRIHYFGFDIDGAAGGGYEDLKGLLNPFNDESAVQMLLTRLERVPGETLEHEILRLELLLENAKAQSRDLKTILGEDNYLDLCEWVLTLRDSFNFNHISNSAQDYKTLNIAMAAREEVMCRHVKFYLERMKPTDKLVLMGHNRHLSKDMRVIKQQGGALPGGNQLPPLGAYVHSILPGQVFSIWQLQGYGRSSHPYPSLSNEYVAKPRTLNEILIEVGSNFLLPTAGASLLQKNIDIVGLYNSIYRTAIAQQADGIFFIRQVSPLRGE